MECISIFDMLKIGVGPSSSHTLGPWRAAQRFLLELQQTHPISSIKTIQTELYGSLSLTGKGHATDVAVMLGLSGEDPVTMQVENIGTIIDGIKQNKTLFLLGNHAIPYIPTENIIFLKTSLPFHANGIKFSATLQDNTCYEETFYSIGGGFVVTEERVNAKENIQVFKTFPFPTDSGRILLEHCTTENKSISEIVLENELSLRSHEEIDTQLKAIWETMLECMHIGCHTQGTLPGGLNVHRRAFDIHEKLIGDFSYNSPQEWLETIRKTEVKFRQILKWVSCFALSVNEVNASLGRVVTAPTNGSAGVIPAVLMYYMVIENHSADFKDIKKFLLVAGEIGSLFKKGATISAAMGGCQAEIGVSSAMAAGALTELLGGTAEQVLIAAEIAMEHHLGLTCDPIGGLVQIPCIERNSFGAIKAISAAELALDTDPKNVKVPLDKVINTMWETAKDMNSKYKETSTGGLAIGVFLSDC
ncbi:L-serine ammonia-lyase [Cellulophaga sp. F20128]|uniref:L-serine ammonia-lyase n=1 Tax=Cellulophaga sp. F20128 TaxID=2926413 RepID=UPI001FF5B67D|nr:L-serine ammonia-lyase [Cellulophaga sp. F20128]MCK0156624.1 L-serine ammonia-lyase [Cellulophaga sp. F20128]